MVKSRLQEVLDCLLCGLVAIAVAASENDLGNAKLPRMLPGGRGIGVDSVWMRSRQQSSEIQRNTADRSREREKEIELESLGEAWLKSKGESKKIHIMARVRPCARPAPADLVPTPSGLAAGTVSCKCLALSRQL